MALFEFCPFTTRPSMSGGIHGFSLEFWTREKCLGEQCKLWTFKKDNNGKTYEGCVFEFVGLDISTIKENKEIKDIKSAECNSIKVNQEKIKIGTAAMVCPKCKSTYDSSWKVCLKCSTILVKNPNAEK